MRIIETKVYTIEEHPNPEKCYQWIRDNWHHLNQHNVDYVIDSFNALQELIGGELDYSISQSPDRGEFIRFTDYDKSELKKINPEECRLTGVCYDQDVIEAVKDNNFSRILDMIHKETEYQYSDDGLFELCIANEYEFNEDGEFI